MRLINLRLIFSRLWQPRSNWGGRTTPAPRTGSPREVCAVQRGGAGARIKRTRAITDIEITWGRETAEATEHAPDGRDSRVGDAVGGERTNP